MKYLLSLLLSQLILLPATALAADSAETIAESTINAGPNVPPKGAWWDDRSASYIGAVGGTSFGLLGAVIGTLGGLGRARRFVTVLHAGGIVVGVVCLAIGLAALMMGQPYAVYYPSLLLGVIGTVVLGALFPVLQRGYAQHELRRMQAVDA